MQQCGYQKVWKILLCQIVTIDSLKMKFDRKGYFQIPLYLSKIPSITCQANKAFLGSFFCTGQQLLWRGKWNFRIDISRLFSLSFFKPKMVRPKQFPKFSILIFFYFSRDQRAQQDHPPRRLRQQALLQRRRGLRLQGRPYSTRIGYNAGMLSLMPFYSTPPRTSRISGPKS